MKLLYITNFSPWPPTSGTRQRNYHIIDHLSKIFEMKIVVLEGPPSIASACLDVDYFNLAKRGDNLSFESTSSTWSRRWSTIKKYLLCSDPICAQDIAADAKHIASRSIMDYAKTADIVWISRSYIAAALLPLINKKNVVVDYDEVMTWREWDHIRKLPWSIHKLLSLVDVCKLGLMELTLVNRVRRVLLCKEEDRSFFKLARDKVQVVPNGAQFRTALSLETQIPNRLLFVGLLSYSPNSEGVSWFANSCFPLIRPSTTEEELVIDIVGDHPPQSLVNIHNKKIRVHGFVNDLEYYYRTATVVVAPLLSGGGTKLKVLEALSYGKAVVATSVACSGLGLRPGIDLEIADTPEKFAAACERLLADSQARVKLGRSGQEWVRQHFSWDRVGELAVEAILQ